VEGSHPCDDVPMRLHRRGTRSLRRRHIPWHHLRCHCQRQHRARASGTRDTVQYVPSQTSDALALLLFYLCTACGPALGAAMAVCLGSSVCDACAVLFDSETLSRAIGAAGIAAVGAVMAALVNALAAATVSRTLGRRCNSTVSGLLDAEVVTARSGEQVCRLAEKQATKALWKSLAGTCFAAAVGTAPPVVVSMASAVLASVIGAVVAAVALQVRRSCRLATRETARALVSQAVFKTGVKSLCSTSIKVLLRHYDVGSVVVTTAVGTGVGIAIRNALVDWVRLRRAPLQKAHCS